MLGGVSKPTPIIFILLWKDANTNEYREEYSSIPPKTDYINEE